MRAAIILGGWERVSEAIIVYWSWPTRTGSVPSPRHSPRGTRRGIPPRQGRPERRGLYLLLWRLQGLNASTGRMHTTKAARSTRSYACTAGASDSVPSVCVPAGSYCPSDRQATTTCREIVPLAWVLRPAHPISEVVLVRPSVAGGWLHKDTEEWDGPVATWGMPARPREVSDAPISLLTAAIQLSSGGMRPAREVRPVSAREMAATDQLPWLLSSSGAELPNPEADL